MERGSDKVTGDIRRTSEMWLRERGGGGGERQQILLLKHFLCDPFDQLSLMKTIPGGAHTSHTHSIHRVTLTIEQLP